MRYIRVSLAILLGFGGGAVALFLITSYFGHNTPPNLGHFVWIPPIDAPSKMPQLGWKYVPPSKAYPHSQGVRISENGEQLVWFKQSKPALISLLRSEGQTIWLQKATSIFPSTPFSSNVRTSPSGQFIVWWGMTGDKPMVHLVDAAGTMIWEHQWLEKFCRCSSVHLVFSEDEQWLWILIVQGCVTAGEKQKYNLSYYDLRRQCHVQIHGQWAKPSLFPRLVSNNGTIAKYYEGVIELPTARGKCHKVTYTSIAAQFSHREKGRGRISSIVGTVPCRGWVLMRLILGTDPEKQQLVCLDQRGKLVWRSPTDSGSLRFGRLRSNEVGTLFWSEEGNILINGQGEIVFQFPRGKAALASRSEYFLVYDNPIGGVKHPPGNVIRYYKASQPEPLWEYRLPAPYVIEAALSGDGKYLAVLGSDACVYFLQCREN